MRTLHIAHQLISTLVIGVSALSLAGCQMPPTMQQCAAKEDVDERDRCTESRIHADVAIGGGVGAAGGAAAGAATGAAIGGVHGAIIGAIVGAATGGATGALITYYVDKRESDALADLQAAGRRLGEARGYYDEKTQRMTSEYVRSDVNDIHSEIDNITELLNKMQLAIDNVSMQLVQFDQAVKRGFGAVPEMVAAEKKKYIAQIAALKRDKEILTQRLNQLNDMRISRQLG